MVQVAYLNGRFLPLAEAQVPVLDRGFLFGDGVYEVIPAYSRRPFRLDEHLSRLEYSLAAIRLPNPHRREEWAALIDELIARNEGEDQYLYLQVTRGPAKRDHAFPAVVHPTVFMMSSQLVVPDAALKAEGIAAVTAQDFRWLRCDIKSISLLANVLLRQFAVDAGAQETVLLRDGYLTEGAASNIFVVKSETIHAPPKSHLMLAGITYDVVIELAQAEGLPLVVAPVPERLVREADELWMTSSTREVLPITRLDGAPVGSGRPGPLFARMDALYQHYKATVMRAPPRGSR